MQKAIQIDDDGEDENDDEPIPPLIDEDDEENASHQNSTPEADKLYPMQLAPTGVWVVGNFNSNPLNVAIDTCSNYSLINANLVKNANLKPKPVDIQLLGAGGGNVNISGYVNITLVIANVKIRSKFYLLDNLEGALIGLSTMEAANISVDAVTGVVTVDGSPVRYSKRPRDLMDTVGSIQEDVFNNV